MSSFRLLQQYSKKITKIYPKLELTQVPTNSPKTVLWFLRSLLFLYYQHITNKNIVHTSSLPNSKFKMNQTLKKQKLTQVILKFARIKKINEIGKLKHT